MGDILDRVIPPADANPERLHIWRLRLALVACGGFLGMLVIGMALTTGLPLVGSVAWADNVEKTSDRRIAAVAAPIQRRLETLERAVEDQTRATNSLLASLAASQVRALAGRLCKETDLAERERLEQEIDRYRAQFSQYSGGHEARIPRCRDL
jgi:hypothetical protein